jgi:hypothetical protein
VRHRRQIKQKRIVGWPQEGPLPAAIADAVSYVGSAEHKGHPSDAGAARLRSDASACDPRYVDFAVPTRALRDAVRARQTSEFNGRFPKYVWGELDGRVYEARLVNHELGQYKGYPIESEEFPYDPGGALAAIGPGRR